MAKIKYYLEYKAGAEALERFKESGRLLRMENITQDFPFDKETRKKCETKLHAMEEKLEDSIPGNYTKDKDVNSVSFYNALKNDVGEQALKSNDFKAGFKELAYVVILKIIYCTFHDIEIFPGFIKQKKRTKREKTIKKVLSSLELLHI
jgi:hypothetical protein